MISARTPPCTRLFNPRTTAKAFATVRGLRQSTTQEAEETEAPEGANDFILSILRARPSLRDTKSYLASFGPRPAFPHVPAKESISSTLPLRTSLDQPATKPTPLVEAILDPIHRRTALVKFQGPFNERQLESIARGMVYLGKLGLGSVIVVESDDWKRGEEGEREKAMSEVMRVVSALEGQGAKARPILTPAVHLGPRPDDPSSSREPEFPQAHTVPSDLVAIRSALRAGEVPVVPPIVLDSFCRSVRIDGNDVIAALARGMVEAAERDRDTSETDLTPYRLMIISREGGIPSYARSGLPHLLVNLTSETQHIHDTYMPEWKASHPTSLANLKLAKKCLEYMPRTSSAVMVSHRSPSSLIANLITNKPAQSSSLPHALLSGTKKLTRDTPTLLRHGLPIRVIRDVAELDKAKMTSLLEKSFGRVLDTEAFYKRVDERLDFAIVAGDYAGAAIVTNEGDGPNRIAYLDKFAVLPSHQGDGTVDFLWVALHDESYGLGLSSSLNPNGGMEGMGTGRDLVWRSRANNPVNKWYFERSSGHLRLGEWVLFWCDAEVRLKHLAKERKATSLLPAGRDELGLLRFVEEDECGRLGKWAAVASSIPSSWQR